MIVMAAILSLSMRIVQANKILYNQTTSCDCKVSPLTTASWKPEEIMKTEMNCSSFFNILLFSGDIELNPGPVSAESLLQGVAQLASSAPEGCVKKIILSWAPDKDVKADLDKLFKVPELKEALAWLKNTSLDSTYVKSFKRKVDILEAVLIALERLLPDHCETCDSEYTTARDSEPALQCAGCQQGYHQQCFEQIIGNSVMPYFPGRLYWLCFHCSSRFSLMTSVASDGTAVKPHSKRAVVTAVDKQQENTNTVDTPPPSLHPSPQLSDTDNSPQQLNASDGGVTEALTRAVLPDCPQLIRGDCPHGMSGKKNGVCQYLHRPRCSTFMKWGDKAPNGCKKVPCDKLHPQVCPRSLDLKCLEVNCDLKLHVKKCVRKGRASFNNQQRSGSRSTVQSTRQRGNRVQQPWSRNETYRQSSFVRNPWSGNNNIENNFHMFQGQHGLSTSNQ